MPALVGLVMIQLVLSGALVPVAGRAVLEQLAWLAPARWGFAAAAASVDLDKAKRNVPGEVLDPLYDQSAGQYLFDLGMLAAVLVVISMFAFWAVRRSATPATDGSARKNARLGPQERTARLARTHGSAE